MSQGATGPAGGVEANITLQEHWRARGLHTDERIGWMLTRAAERWPRREAMVFEGQRITYHDLWRWCSGVAEDLLQGGLRPGDRLLWQLPNCLEAVVLHFAAWRVGAVCVPVVPLYREHEMARILQDVQPRAVAFSTQLGARRPVREMERLMAEVGVTPTLRYAVGARHDGWLSVRDAPPDGVPDSGRCLPDPLPADECCLILYTSGTTSIPKGVRHSSRSLLAEASTWRLTYGFGFDDTFLMGAPVSHIAGLLVTLVVPASSGARTVLLPAWDPDSAVALAEKERATFCVGASIFLEGFVERYERGCSPSHRLNMFLCGGAAVPPSLIERAEACGIRAWRCWGMTEAPTTTLAAPDDPLELRAYRDGRASEGTEIEAVDEHRRPLSPGEIGHLRVRSPEQMLGYTDPEVTAREVDGDGWFYTGDVGTVDADGWVTICGRLKDIVNRGGEKFSCQEIEQVIATHPAIASVAVLGVPDERLGEKVAAFVTLRPGADWPGRQALLDHVESARLARPKQPVEWRVLDAIPVTLSGKIQKDRLLVLWTESLAGEGNPA